ncbi:MAG TPA: hypothetical protein VIF82_08035 [Burkholderiaceae bacterium]|jgi:hypothetical protein
MNASTKRNAVTMTANFSWLLCAVAWWFEPQAFLPAYLAVWWFWIGIAMGGLANVWLHNLTGGAWGEAIRTPLLEIGGSIWVGCLLFFPVLAALWFLYPWAPHAVSGTTRWAGELSAADFKSVWLLPPFFILRSILYLVTWSILGILSRRPALRRSPSFSSAALIIYGVTVSLAAFDWIMSLMPLWYSSIFGMVAGTTQMMSGMVMAIVLAAFQAARPPPSIFRDLGNLLMMYVLTWAYLAFMQFLIIWAENLPHEIAWYVPRLQSGWIVVAWMLVLLLFFVPLLMLLSRPFKQSAQRLGWLAVGLLIMLLIDACWMVLPSTAVASIQWLWSVPLALIALSLAALAVWRARRSLPSVSNAGKEQSHV